jgi:transcriptional regulator with XRE-family HTH domain
MSNFGTRLKAAREAAGLSIDDAAASVGVIPTLWQFWENGTREPQAETFLRVAEELGVDEFELGLGRPRRTQEDAIAAFKARRR